MTMEKQKKQSESKDSPQKMMERVFVVAELILHSNGYQKFTTIAAKTRTKTQT